MSILAIAGLEVEGGDALPWHRVRVPHEEARRRVVHLGWGFVSESPRGIEELELRVEGSGQP